MKFSNLNICLMSIAALFVLLTFASMPVSASYYKYNPFTKTTQYVSLTDILRERRHAKGLDTVTPVQTNAYIRQQKLDHFNREDNRTFSQTYYVNTEFVNASNPNTPVFFLLGWEGALSGTDIELGSFVIANFAQEYNGLLIAVEHRFYGDSIPSIPGQTYTELLPYLTSEQALADYASYYDLINEQYKTSGRWIVLSGSYGGNLAAWARLKYPHLFYGAFSISAPVQATVNYEGYFEVVGDVLAQVNCSAQLTTASNKITELLADSSAGWAQLQKDFNLCGPITDIRDGGVLISQYANSFAGTVQYAVGDEVEQLCQSIFLTNDSYADVVNFFSSRTQCSDFSYSTYLQSFQPIADQLSWQWQTCNEFGYYQTGDGTNNPISKFLSLDFYTDVCDYLWNITAPAIDGNIAWTNVNYGGWNISTSNTFFSNGGNDPWHVAGVLEGNHGYYNYIAISAGASHCQDMDAPSSGDSPALKKTREYQLQVLKTWLTADSTTEQPRIVQM